LPDVTLAARVSKEISDLIGEISAEEKVDRSTVVRRLLDMGVRDWRIQNALERYGRGSITLPRAAELAGVSIYEMIAILEERKIPYRYDLSDLEEYVKKRHG
jgi:predicted HTH domain antitoxin